MLTAQLLAGNTHFAADFIHIFWQLKVVYEFNKELQTVKIILHCWRIPKNVFKRDINILFGAFLGEFSPLFSIISTILKIFRW